MRTVVKRTSASPGASRLSISTHSEIGHRKHAGQSPQSSLASVVVVVLSFPLIRGTPPCNPCSYIPQRDALLQTEHCRLFVRLLRLCPLLCLLHGQNPSRNGCHCEQARPASPGRSGAVSAAPTRATSKHTGWHRVSELEGCGSTQWTERDAGNANETPAPAVRVSAPL